ncbi:MAG: phosphoglucosamine mutase [Halobacteriota archaeon]
MTLFGSSGARGSLEGGFDVGLVARIAQAAANHWSTPRVVVGRDVRLTGPSFAAAATAGITAAGSHVDRVGIAPTPAVQRYALEAGLPAVIVTASHNPPEYNGVKLSDATGGEISMSDYRAIERRIDEDRLETAAWDEFGTIRYVEGINDTYVSRLVDAIDADRIADAAPTVAVDPGNGAGGLTSPQLFRRLGCAVHTVNAQLDGTFPGRSPEPLPVVLGELSALVEAVDADLGVAHDGDADRAVFVDERARPIEGAAVLAALAEELVSEGDVIVSAITSSRRLEEVAERVGARLELTRVGAAHILSRVRELEAEGETVALAGEDNGGIIVPGFARARDGGYVAGRVLELVAGRPASAVFEPYTGYVTTRLDIPVDDVAERDQLLDRAGRWVERQEGTVRTVDGHRLDLDDAWVLVRASGTEPLIRVYAEAARKDRARDLVEAVTAYMTD